MEELCRAEVMAPPSVTGVRLRWAACVLCGWLTWDSLWHNASPVQQRGHALAAVQGRRCSASPRRQGRTPTGVEAPSQAAAVVPPALGVDGCPRC